MMKLSSILTVLVWSALLCWIAFSMFASRFHQARGGLAFVLVAIFASCCAISLAVIAATHRSRRAIRWLLVLSVLSALWAGLGAWMMISPITVVGLRYFGTMTLVGRLWLIGLLTMFLLPWLWGIVYYRSREQVTHVA
jgi:NADH:ubiquinone oxidoreductase subunit K